MFKDNPFFNNSSFNFDQFFLGFDPLVEKFTNAIKDAKTATNWPPYNVKKVNDSNYVIEMAVAGLAKNDIEIEFNDGSLTVKGSVTSDSSPEEYLYKGIAERAFTRTFTLADNIKVENAQLVNGVLKIWLETLAKISNPTKIDIKDK